MRHWLDRLLCSPGLAVALIGACLAAAAVVLGVGIDDLDEGYFVQQATRVAVHGQVPYLDFDSLYTPGLLYLHASLFGLLGGPSIPAMRIVSLLARAGLATELYGLARPLVRRPLVAALPALFLLVGLDAAPNRWEPHPAWLATVFALLAAACIATDPTTASRRRLIGAGAAAGLAYLFKQNTGVFILGAVLLQTRRRGGLPLAAFSLITLAWLAPLLLAIHGRADLLGGFVGAVNQAGLFARPEPPSLVVPACLAGGLWLATRRDADARVRSYLISGSALLLTQYPRMDTLHLAWSTPLLLVVGAVALERAPARVASVALVGLALAALPVLNDRVQPLLHSEAATQADLALTVADIQRRTQPAEPIFVYPSSPLLYALAERANPTRFDHLYPGAASPAQVRDVLADLDRSQVRLVVVSDFWEHAWGPPGPNQPLEDWLAGSFVEVDRHGAYRVLAYNRA